MLLFFWYVSKLPLDLKSHEVTGKNAKDDKQSFEFLRNLRFEMKKKKETAQILDCDLQHRCDGRDRSDINKSVFGRRMPFAAVERRNSSAGSRRASM